MNVLLKTVSFLTLWFVLCPRPKRGTRLPEQGAGGIAQKRAVGGSPWELAFSDWFLVYCQQLFLPKTLAGTWGCVAEAEVQLSGLGTGRWVSLCQEVAGTARCLCPAHAASHSTTVALEGASSWFWSISYTWKAVKPFRSRNTSTAFNWTIYSFKFTDFAGQVSVATAGLDGSTAWPDVSRALLRVSGCLLQTSF